MSELTSLTLKDALLGGWRIAPLMQAQSGLPYTGSITGYPAQSASGVRGANAPGSSRRSTTAMSVQP